MAAFGAGALRTALGTYLEAFYVRWPLMPRRGIDGAVHRPQRARTPADPGPSGVGIVTSQMMDASTLRAALDVKYLNLETYRTTSKAARVSGPLSGLHSRQRMLQLATLRSSMSTQPQIPAKRSASARAAWSRSPRATCVGPCPANGSMPTPRSPAAKSSSAVCGLSTANTVRGSRSSIYLYCCFAVMNATRKPGPAPERELHVAFLFSLAVCTHGRIHAEPAGELWSSPAR